jgi:small-conductance mechanosensitive channel
VLSVFVDLCCKQKDRQHKTTKRQTTQNNKKTDNTNQQKDKQHKTTKRQTKQINKKTDNTKQQKDRQHKSTKRQTTQINKKTSIYKILHKKLKKTDQHESH